MFIVGLHHYLRSPKWAVLGLALVLGACEQSAEMPPLKVGVLGGAGSNVFYLAEASGYIKPNDAKFIHLPPTIDKEYALKTGLVDALTVPLATAIAWQRRDIDLSIILVTTSSAGKDAIAIVDKPENLANRESLRVAVDRDSEDLFLVYRYLQERLKVEKPLEIKYLSDATAMSGLKDGSIDIAALSGASIKIAKNNNINMPFTSADIPGELLEVMVVRRENYEHYIDTLEKVIVGWRTAREEFGDRFDGAELPSGGPELDQLMASLEGVTLTSLNTNLRLMAQNGRAFQEIMLKRTSVEGGSSTNATVFPVLDGRFLFSEERSED